jgi:hypothetical protein
MEAKKHSTPPREPDGGPESVLPGERSGEGSADLFRHIVRDEQRKAGLPKRPPPERDKPPERK